MGSWITDSIDDVNEMALSFLTYDGIKNLNHDRVSEVVQEIVSLGFNVGDGCEFSTIKVDIKELMNSPPDVNQLFGNAGPHANEVIKMVKRMKKYSHIDDNILSQDQLLAITNDTAYMYGRLIRIIYDFDGSLTN